MKKYLRGIYVLIMLCIIFLAACSKNKAVPDRNDAIGNGSDDGMSDKVVAENATQITLNSSDSKIKGSGASIDGKNINITEGGIYEISGSLEDGQLIINTFDKSKVQLIFNGVSIHSTKDAPVYVKKADSVTITLQENTQNYLSDEDNYSSTDNNDPDAAVYCNSDLTIEGLGALTVVANYKNGISGKEALDIMDASIQVSSVGDGITGRNSLEVKNTELTINSKGDALKATNSKASDKGYIVIDGGSLSIISDSFGIKAESSLTINSGSISVESSDDSFHSIHDITIKGGDISISSGDDGIHAGTSTEILDGKIQILKSYEGMESGDHCTISGGEIRIVSDEDGINVAGGNDEASNGDNQIILPDTADYCLTINGGYIIIDATGDGLDSNGSIVITGGIVLVNGPTSKKNGPLDYVDSLEVNGGTLIAAGSAGPGQSPSAQSSQNSISITFSQKQDAGTLIHVEDSTGKTLVTFAPAKKFQSMVISLPEIKSGETYSLYTDGSFQGDDKDGVYTNGDYSNGSQVAEFTVSESVTYIK